MDKLSRDTIDDIQHQAYSNFQLQLHTHKAIQGYQLKKTSFVPILLKCIKHALTNKECSLKAQTKVKSL